MALDAQVLPDAEERARQRRGWYWYDWANSAFATTVLAVFLGPYLTAVAEEAAGCPDAEGGGSGGCTRTVDVLGLDVAAGSYYSYVLALSIAVQVLVLPLVGALADRTRRKREILGVLAYLGSFATMALYLVEGERYLLGGVLYLLAQMAFGSAMVVYHSFLPELAAPDERDRTSARGWAMGYAGGGLLLLLNLVLYGARDSLGLSEGHAVRISLLSAGVWWAGFTVIPLARLRNRRRPPAEHSGGVVAASAGQLWRTVRDARRYPMTLLFLAAYLVYNDGIQSVITLAALYGDRELGFGQDTLILAILLVQVVAVGGALLLGRLAETYGAKRVVLVSLALWALVVLAGYVLQEGATLQFFALAAAIGLVMGGSQALSRSLFAQMIPAGKEAEYFGLYEISERGTSWLGALLFGLVFQLTGSYREALLSVLAFFVVGALLLTRVDVRRAIAEAGNPQPRTV